MKVALALTLLASPALLAHAAEGTRGGGEEEESSPKTLAWFVHMPKTAGTWLLNKFAQCLGDCSRPSAHGPRGTLVENFVEMGLVTAAEVTASLHNTKQKCGIREGAHRDYVARCEARGNTRNEKSWQKDRPVVCGSTAQHWPYEYSLELKRRVVKAGLRPVIIGSMRIFTINIIITMAIISISMRAHATGTSSCMPQSTERSQRNGNRNRNRNH